MKIHFFYKPLMLFITVFFFLWAGNECTRAQVNTHKTFQVQVNKLSDQQLRELAQQMKSSGMSEAEAVQKARERGLSAQQIGQLKQRMEKLEANEGDTPKNTVEEGDQSQDIAAKMLNPAPDTLQKRNADVYGMVLFSGAKPQFTPNLNMATPMTYVIGIGDQINLNLYGNSEANEQLQVNKQGKINIPYVGAVAVSGMSIQQLRSVLKSKMSGVYKGLKTGKTQLEVTLGEIRSVQVILTGEVRAPGTYTLPSVATVYNALYAAGGPSRTGSLRNIQVFRHGKLLTEMDVYTFLQTGVFAGNATLKDGDIVKVNPAKRRVKLSGEVRRPLFFDLKKGETFADLLAYAGGFTSTAYKDRVKVIRNTDTRKAIVDLLASQYHQFTPRDGDRFTVSKILQDFENRVSIHGAVFRPGDYELSSGLTLSMLIKKAEGLKEDAYTKSGYINREKPNLEIERIPFSPAKLMAGLERDIELKKEDRVYIYSIFDLKDEYKVRIQGEVRHPGTFDYAEGMKVGELIMQAGGFKESGSAKRIEISRRIQGDSTRATTADTFYVNLESKEDLEGDTTTLHPYDLVIVRPTPGYVSQKTVRVEGEVNHPGIYTIRNRNEKIADLIQRAGGLTDFAYPKGASLRRGGGEKNDGPESFARESGSEKFADQEEKSAEQEQLKKSRIANQSVSESKATNPQDILAASRNKYVGVHLEHILKDPSSPDNILVEDGDVIYIPQKLETVSVSGEVLSPVTTVFRKGEGLKYYISNAGGYTQESLRRRVYVVYADGSTQGTKSFLGIKTYPKIEPGAQIFVPKRREREHLDGRAWIGIGTALASLAAIIYSIIK